MCNSLKGRVYTYDMWMSSGVWPGFHLNCDCFLKMVGEEYVLSDPDFFGTDLNLLSDTINPIFFTFRLHWDPNYVPFSWYMSEQITEAHRKMGADLPIGEVLRRMKDEFMGFFKRSDIFDNFFVWRVFRSTQHYQNNDDTASGGFPWGSLRKNPFKMTYDIPRSFYYQQSTLKPEPLQPLYPYQSNYTEDY